MIKCLIHFFRKLINRLIKMRTTLYIMGNGFDLAHEMKTSYMGFKKFLETNQNYNDLVDKLEYFYSGKEDFKLWENFETALGNVSVNNIMSYARELAEENRDEDDIEGQFHYQEDLLDIDSKSIHENLANAFCEWIYQISTNNIAPVFKLNKNDLFLTMNYTKTLEDVYQIQSGNILHIHGDVDDGNLIFGHGNSTFSSDVKEDSQSVITDNATSDAESLFEEFKKPVKKIIERNKSFFSQLNGKIDCVKIIGHSMSDVDMAYFERIFNEVGNNAEWIIYYHGEETESEPKKKKLIDIGILEQNIHIESQKNILNT